MRLFLALRLIELRKAMQMLRWYSSASNHARHRVCIWRFKVEEFPNIPNPNPNPNANTNPNTNPNPNWRLKVEGFTIVQEARWKILLKAFAKRLTVNRAITLTLTLTLLPQTFAQESQLIEWGCHSGAAHYRRWHLNRSNVKWRIQKSETRHRWTSTRRGHSAYSRVTSTVALLSWKALAGVLRKQRDWNAIASRFKRIRELAGYMMHLRSRKYRNLLPTPTLTLSLCLTLTLIGG